MGKGKRLRARRAADAAAKAAATAARTDDERRARLVELATGEVRDRKTDLVTGKAALDELVRIEQAKLAKAAAAKAARTDRKTAAAVGEQQRRRTLDALHRGAVKG